MWKVWSVGIVVALGLLVAACGAREATSELSESATSLAQAEIADSVPIAPDEVERFMSFPSQPNDGWLIGVDYQRVSFVDLVTGDELAPSEVSVHFLGGRHISMSSGGCAIGSGNFVLADGRITEHVLDRPLMVCDATDGAVFDAAQDLIFSDPDVRSDGNQLLLVSGRHRLVLEAEGPGIVPIIDDQERFVGVESDVAGIDPTRLEVSSAAHFVFTVNAPSCDLHGAMAEDQTTFQMQPMMGIDPCEFSPSTDKAAQAYFGEGGTASRTGDTVEVVNSQGSITFRLAGVDDPPLQTEAQIRPPRVIPDQPDRSSAAAAGTPSVPWFAQRAGTTSSGGVDVPVPEGWDARDAAVPMASVAGRGTLGVFDVPADQLPWSAEEHSPLDLLDGPNPVTIKLYAFEDGEVVESGATVTANQYRYGSSDPGEWRREVVWVLERDGTTTVAAVGFPDFPDDSSFADPADSIDLSLTGFDPIDLLHDVRFFE